MLGSHIGSYRCAVSCYGVPLRTEWINIPEPHEVSRELEVSLVGEDGETTGETVLLELGSFVNLLCTGGITLMGILLPDGHIGRIEAGSENPASTVAGGESIFSCFVYTFILD